MRAAFLVLLLAGSAWPQTGGIRGQVVNAKTGEPVRKAQVILRWAENPGQPYGAWTDTAGRFVLTDVEPGLYRLAAEHNGFVRSEYGARRAGHAGRPFRVEAGQDLSDMVIRLVPQGVITGRVIDSDGDAVANAGVQLLRYRYRDSVRRLVPGMSSFTNDLGQFRLHGLPAGRYLLEATYRPPNQVMPSSGRNTAVESAYAPVFYPNATEPAAASPLDVVAGGEIEGIELRLSPVNAVRIRGRVMAESGPASQGLIMLFPIDLDEVPLRAAGQIRGPNGTFELQGVFPGSYWIVAQSSPQGAHRMVGRQQITVGDADIDDIDLTLASGTDMEGRVVAEGQEDIRLASLRVFAAPKPGQPVIQGPVNVSVGADGAFALRNLMPQDYRVRVSGLTGNWYVKSIRAGQQDVLAGGLSPSAAAGQMLDVQISPSGGSIEGIVADNDHQPAVGATIVMIPEDRARIDEYKVITSDENGRFSLRGIRPGDYKLFAWDEPDPDSWFDPEFVKGYDTSGSAISIGEGARQSVELRLLEVGDDGRP